MLYAIATDFLIFLLICHDDGRGSLVLLSMIRPSLVLSLLLTALAVMSPRATTLRKHLWIIRHGQAVHNPRAESAKAAGCSHQEFLELMRQDDALDADLTDLGEKQANSARFNWDGLQLVVSSPLSRAIRTADLVVPPSDGIKRVVVEDFREINGWLLNAKRQSVRDLKAKFPDWDFGELIHEADVLWTSELESQMDCAERGYRGFHWLWQRPEERILLAGHGGILRFTMQYHSHVKVSDQRSNGINGRKSDARFGNCEVRKYLLEVEDDPNTERPIILLAEVNIDHHINYI
jgi:broad specificity phosphatase PhoE